MILNAVQNNISVKFGICYVPLTMKDKHNMCMSVKVKLWAHETSLTRHLVLRCVEHSNKEWYMHLLFLILFVLPAKQTRTNTFYICCQYKQWMLLTYL